MATERDADLLTIAEVSRQLKVSRVTLHRWLKSGRLRAYHVGPKAIRIRRADLDRLLTPVHSEGVTVIEELSSHPIYTSIEQIPPLTEEQKQRAFEALERGRQLGERILARRGGVPLSDSAEIIREAREERSKQLL